jgi:hypothetical protein
MNHPQPFGAEWHTWGKAFGLEYVIRFQPDAFDREYLAEIYLRFPVGHPCYRVCLEAIFGDVEIPDSGTPFYAAFGVTPKLQEDHNSWWIGFAYVPTALEEAVGVAEDAIQQITGARVLPANAATLGPHFTSSEVHHG